MSAKLTSAAKEVIRQTIQGVGVKGEIAKAAKRLLRETEEYKKRVRWRDGTAATWLDEEGHSFAEAAYDLLLDRVDEFGGRPRAKGKA